ncbi:MAG: DNA polymerase, partial [Candidatus Paceibacterota bacterium]
DVHASVASEVFDVPEDSVTKAQRSHAKAINFGILYGMGVNALKANLGEGTTQKQARQYLDEYFESFSELAEWIEKVKKDARKNGYTETYFGRRRYFSGIRSKARYIQAQAERMAINAPIQGTQADVIKLAMVKVDDYIQKEGLENDVRLLLQVHDELVYEIRSTKKKEVGRKIKEIMESIVPKKETKGITFIAEAEVGPNWGELTPLTT